jgi:hypothetical protein
MFNDRPAVATALPESNYIQPNLGHGLRIWWAFFWRNAIIVAILTALAGMAVKALYERGLASANVLRPVMQYGSYVIAYTSALFVLHFIVRKKFQRFRINLIPVGGSENAEALPATMKRTFRIWWTFAWRTVVYGVILNFAANVPMAFLNGLVAVIYPPLAAIFAQLVSLVIGAAIGLFVIYANILDEDFGSFRVTLAPNVAIPTAPVVVVDAPVTDVPNPGETPNPIV